MKSMSLPLAALESVDFPSAGLVSAGAAPVDLGQGRRTANSVGDEGAGEPPPRPGRTDDVRYPTPRRTGAMYGDGPNRLPSDGWATVGARKSTAKGGKPLHFPECGPAAGAERPPAY